MSNTLTTEDPLISRKCVEGEHYANTDGIILKASLSVARDSFKKGALRTTQYIMKQGFPVGEIKASVLNANFARYTNFLQHPLKRMFQKDFNTNLQ